MAKRTFHAYNFNENNTYAYDVNIEDTRQCMHCLQTGVQNFMSGIITNGRHDKYNSIAVFSCPLCASSTIHFLFNWQSDSPYNELEYHESHKTYPDKIENPIKKSDELHADFPEFFEIYLQSQKAENADLDQIAGMGYRKALEFLVTDYLLKYPVDGVSEDWLNNPNTSLGNKISKIPNSRMQTLAKATSFLGNDETHYTRRHPEHDIDSMKAFISVLLSEIENEIAFRKAEELINKPKD